MAIENTIRTLQKRLAGMDIDPSGLPEFTLTEWFRLHHKLGDDMPELEELKGLYSPASIDFWLNVVARWQLSESGGL